MTAYFADTSAIAKRYLSETGSAWVKSWSIMAAGNTVVISDLTTVEIASLLARRRREGLFSVHTQRLLQNIFLVHALREYLTVPLDSTVLKLARSLLHKHPLRTLDSPQLACAQQAAQALSTPLVFVGADKNLLTAAAAEGFATDDPNVHS